MGQGLFLIFVVFVTGCASLKSEEHNSRTPASTQGANWLVRVCRTTDHTSVLKYVETVATNATPEQLQSLNSNVRFINPSSGRSDSSASTCTCDLVASLSENATYVNRSLYDLMTEADQKKLMNDLSVGIGVPSSDIKSWCANKLKAVPSEQ
jgi:hypothetical protein